MRDFRDAKAMARSLRNALKARAVETTNSESLELISKAFGYENWNVLSAQIEAAEVPATDQRSLPQVEAQRDPAPPTTLYCSFCGKSQHEVRKLVAGPDDVFICDERWVGHASSAFAIGQVVVKHRKDETGARVPITIPDHIDVTGHLQQGGQYRLVLSAVIGHTPSKTEAWIYGDKGTLAFITPNNGEPYLQFGKKGGAMGALAIDPTKRGAWRVEEEFVSAVRGREAVTHTDFVTATKYMEWTDAVTLSMRERREVQLPLLHGTASPRGAYSWRGPNG
jgi:hypothetical protein